jgi:hypothetical protein
LHNGFLSFYITSVSFVIMTHRFSNTVTGNHVCNSIFSGHVWRTLGFQLP